jgi:hypothetical protein
VELYVETDRSARATRQAFERHRRCQRHTSSPAAIRYRLKHQPGSGHGIERRSAHLYERAACIAGTSAAPRRMSDTMPCGRARDTPERDLHMSRTWADPRRATSTSNRRARGRFGAAGAVPTDRARCRGWDRRGYGGERGGRHDLESIEAARQRGGWRARDSLPTSPRPARACAVTMHGGAVHVQHRRPVRASRQRATDPLLEASNGRTATSSTLHSAGVRRAASAFLAAHANSCAAAAADCRSSART